jgi:glycosyltransferase involved in cell wall biosynthesis
MDEQKGNRYFLEAVKIILNTGCPAKFVLAGDGPLMGDLQKKSKQLDINDHVIFTGHYKDVPLLQSLFDIQVFPSLWEGTPLTIFEAFAMGLPVVSTDVDGLGEVIQNNINGLIVPPKDSQALAERILDLISHPDKAKKLAEKAHKESATYNNKKCVRKIESIYSDFFTSAPVKGH